MRYFIKATHKTAVFLIFLFTICCFIFSYATAKADEREQVSYVGKGIIEGFGKEFIISDSAYLNISLESSDDINLRMESIPKIIVIKIYASDDVSKTNIKISGLDPDVTYHKYEDDYRNYAPISADEHGAFSYEQDISEDHIIFIQPKKSTVIINNDATGGNCSNIGSWDALSKTCTLNKDVNETIQISSDGITLDGDHHVVSASISNNGIYVLSSRVIVKNVTVTNSAYGIYQYRGNYNTYENNNLSGNSYGMRVDYNANNNTIKNNIIGSSAFTGLSVSSSNNVMRENKMDNNLGYGFFISGTNVDSNDIDTSNKVDNRPIYFLKDQVDKSFETLDMGGFFCFDCKNITFRGNKLSKYSLVYLSNTTNSNMEYQSSEKTMELILIGSSNNFVRNNNFTRIRLLSSSNGNKIYNNNIGRGYNVVLINSSSGNTFSEDLPTRGNYWETNIYCHDLDSDGFCDSPYTINSSYGAMDYHPYAKPIDNTIPETITGPSNVLFLPGLEGSRLYKDGLFGNDELWPPTFASNDMQQLLLNNNGQSIENIFTNDIIESVGGNIYKTFADKLRSLKNDGMINDFNLFAYDWRQSVEDIAQNGTPYAGMTMRSATLQAKALAITSKSKKVTIVAHSNGGLLAKAIMLELKKEGKEDMVDKIVFVASPQMGTPRAITSILYGYDEGLVSGWLTTDAEMRTLAENMPGAYGLLPSKKYLERVEDPMIKFSSDNTRYKAFKDAYGDDITKNEYDQFFSFLLGNDDGRTKPDADDTQFENVLNESLLEQAKETHERLDTWTPPASMKVYEIAGWGLDTISGVEYREKEGTRCESYNSKVPSCMKTDSFFEPYFDPMWTVDGDKVVVAPSALMLENSDNVKRYWVDLYRSNGMFKVEMEHSDVLEVDSVNNFVSNILTSEETKILPDYISTSRPNDYASAKPRLRMSLYSPLDIHLYANGKHTGPMIVEENGQQFKTFEEQIPNSYYYQFGERKYVGIPVGENVHMEMDGYGDGAYTLKIEEVKETENGEEVVAKTVFANLPVSPDTKVTLDIPETGLENMPNLKTDYDGDGENDYEAAVVLGGEAQIVDNVKPTIEITSPEAKEYLNNQMVDLAYSVMDNLSPQSDVVVQKYLDGNQIDNNNIDLSMLNLGNHTIKITTTDKAGNTQEKEIAFSVTTSLQAIKDNVQKYYDAKLIKSKQQKNVLLVSLEIIEQRLEFLEMIKNNPYISQKAKNMIAMIVQKQIEEHVGFLIKQINHQQKFYDSKIKQLLIEDLKWLENNAAV